MNELLQSKDVRRSLLVVLILLSVFLLVKSINELKTGGYSNDTNYQSTIAVRGEGEVSATPDIATFWFSVTEEDEELKDAQNAVSEKVSKILDSLEDLGVEEEDITTTSYNIYPRYEYYQRQQICPDGYYCPPASGERVLVGYEASQNVSIKLRDLDKAGDVLNSLGGSGVSNVNGPSFDIEKRDELMAEAREMAIDNAKEEAKKLAKDLGVRLGRIVSFSDNQNFYKAVRYDTAVAESYGMGGDFAPTPEIPVGESEISASVEIVYEIK